MQNPCLNCNFQTGRYPGCQDHCEKPERLAYTQLIELSKRNRKNQRNIDSIIMTVQNQERRLKDWGNRYYG